MIYKKYMQNVCKEVNIQYFMTYKYCNYYCY